MIKNLNAKQIVALLAKKHEKDLFVAECKDGSTWSEGGALRLDAWAMRRSWTQWTTWGYEVKVNRPDFVQDEKWTEYLPLCHRFSFVCPYHMIEPEELPPSVGLLWVTKTGNRLYTKRKAANREIETPLSVLLYVLMSRAVIVSNMWEANRGLSKERNRQRWQAWLQQKEDDQILGMKVATRMGDIVAELERRARKAERRAYLVEETAKCIENAIGIPLGELSSWNRECEIRKLLRGFPLNLCSALTHARDSADKALQQLLDLQASHTPAGK